MHFHSQHADIAERFSERRAKAVAGSSSTVQVPGEDTWRTHARHTHTYQKLSTHLAKVLARSKLS